MSSGRYCSCMAAGGPVSENSYACSSKSFNQKIRIA